MNKQAWIECSTCGHRESMVGRRVAVDCQMCGSEWLDARYDYGALAGDGSDADGGHGEPKWRERLTHRPNTICNYCQLQPLQDT